VVQHQHERRGDPVSRQQRACKLSQGIGSANGWQIVDTGDYNGDGKSDILWETGAGTLGIWFMNGATPASTALLGTVPNWGVSSGNF
jgi:hypothetical protein